MLDEVFMPVLDMTKTGSIVILAVLLARLCLKKAPKWISYALWAVVLLRLLCPVSVVSDFSILPELTPVAQNYDLAGESISFAGASEAAYQAVGDALNGGLGIQHIRTTGMDDTGMSRFVTTDWWDVWILFGQYVWLAGMGVMALCSAVSYLRIRRKLAVVMPLTENVYIAQDISSPFVIGLLRPKIYLPAGLGEKETGYILQHEQHHIRRFDHVLKALGYLALCIHWFNPLVWLAFMLACRDMEMSCDEAVIRKMGEDIRADYAASLLTLATGQRIIAGMPLAFGEGDPKERIRNLSRWKKPVFWVVLAAVIGCVALALCLLTDPAPDNTMLMGAEYRVEKTLYATAEEYFISPDMASWCITADMQLYRLDGAGEWAHLGQLLPYEFDRETLMQYAGFDGGWQQRYRGGEVAECYILFMPDDYFYLAFLTERGDTMLAYGWEDVSERHQGASDDTGLKWLYRLESVFEDVGRTGSFLDRSLEASVGSDVDIYYTWINDYLPGYVIVGFLAGEGGFNEKPDMGFAVFYHNQEKTYYLLDCHSYENAALAENGIYFCPDPAVADKYGEMRSDCTYDMILINSELVQKVTRVITYSDGTTKEESELVSSPHDLALFSWKYDDAGSSVSYQFYDEKGNTLDWGDPDATVSQTGGAEGPESVAVEASIEKLLALIESNPAEASDPSAYIGANFQAYQQLLDYGELTLRYVFTQFLAGDQTGLRGHILRSLLDDLAPESALRLYAGTGQEYFDTWLDAAATLYDEKGRDWMAENHPASLLALEMAG